MSTREPQRRVRRPDPAVPVDAPVAPAGEEVSPSAETAEIDANSADVTTDDLAEEGEAPAPVPTPKPGDPKAPFRAMGISVIDTNNRPLCTVSSAHLNIEQRAATAEWIANRLNLADLNAG